MGGLSGDSVIMGQCDMNVLSGLLDSDRKSQDVYVMPVTGSLVECFSYEGQRGIVFGQKKAKDIDEAKNDLKEFGKIAKSKGLKPHTGMVGYAYGMIGDKQKTKGDVIFAYDKKSVDEYVDILQRHVGTNEAPVSYTVINNDSSRPSIFAGTTVEREGKRQVYGLYGALDTESRDHFVKEVRKAGYTLKSGLDRGSYCLYANIS